MGDANKACPECGNPAHPEMSCEELTNGLAALDEVREKWEYDPPPTYQACPECGAPSHPEQSCEDVSRLAALESVIEFDTWHLPGTCGECRWWWPYGVSGECRVRAPRTEDVAVTLEEYGCGEWEPLRKPYEVWEDAKPTGMFRKDDGDRAGRGEAGDG